jgi:hypothetical protein
MIDYFSTAARAMTLPIIHLTIASLTHIFPAGSGVLIQVFRFETIDAARRTMAFPGNAVFHGENLDENSFTFPGSCCSSHRTSVL